MFLDGAIIIFILLELTNVLVMYFKPGFPYGNSMAAFQPWKSHLKDEKLELFHRYMIRWVANCKVIFILLLGVILITGSPEMKFYGVGATVLSIGLYFVTLHPLISRLDALGEISPRGYSRTLGWMIGGFMAMFTLALGAQVMWG